LVVTVAVVASEAAAVVQIAINVATAGPVHGYPISSNIRFGWGIRGSAAVTVVGRAVAA